MTHPNDSAFPEHPGVNLHSGLTKREYFAACALQGILADSTVNGPADMCAKVAVNHADALITELSKEAK